VTYGESTLISGLRHWAEVDPHRIAIADEEVSLTFAQLYRRVSEVARVISDARAGVESSKFLPILADRSVESLVLVLACVYTATPFVLLDGDAPRERLELLLEWIDHAQYVLAVSKYENLQFNARIQILSTKTSNNLLEDPVAVKPDDIANIIFTSGSTGLPKGVLLDWNSLGERVAIRRNYPDEEIPKLRVAVTQPIYFASGMARLLAVTLGISVFIVDPTRMTQLALLKKLNELEATNFSAPSSFIRSLGRIPADEDIFVPTVSLIEIGSEGMRFEDLAPLRRYFSESVLITHGLAASEAASGIRNTFSLATAPLKGQVPLGVENVPGNVRLLPPRDDLSTSQEILLGSRLARGYLNDPELTQERFVFDDDGRRWWKSGDLVFKDEHGVFWHRGRVDDLVKVRGKLASPSEAAHVIAEIPGIESVCVLPQILGDSVRLIAHVVKELDSKVTARDVRRALATQLPSHLNPATLVLHDSLPRTSAGKIDREALQKSPLVAWRDEPVVRAKSAAEFKVKDEAVLVLDVVGISLTDDLWEFGMDSLLAIELLTRIERISRTRFTIDDLLQYRTIEKIAARIEKTFVLENESIIVNESGSKKMMYAIPGVGGHASGLLDLARALGSEQPVMIFPHISKTKGIFDIKAESEKIAKVIFDSGDSNGVPILGYSAGGLVALEVARIVATKGIRPHLLLLDSSFKSSGRSSSIRREAQKRGERLAAKEGLVPKKVSKRPAKNGWFADFSASLEFALQSMMFTLSRGRFPKGVTRYKFLAQKKSRSKRNFVVQPVEFECEATYFHVGKKKHLEAWLKVLPHMEAVFVLGNHNTMLKPPFVAGLATLISQKLTMASK
jgi:acyl-CoA synthetase (AMP-forming)/AMP-acid ligase II/thioesterase domain-containing protein/acyl carrier protein